MHVISLVIRVSALREVINVPQHVECHRPQIMGLYRDVQATILPLLLQAIQSVP